MHAPRIASSPGRRKLPRHPSFLGVTQVDIFPRKLFLLREREGMGTVGHGPIGHGPIGPLLRRTNFSILIL